MLEMFKTFHGIFMEFVRLFLGNLLENSQALKFGVMFLYLESFVGLYAKICFEILWGNSLGILFFSLQMFKKFHTNFREFGCFGDFSIIFMASGKMHLYIFRSLPRNFKGTLHWKYWGILKQIYWNLFAELGGICLHFFSSIVMEIFGSCLDVLDI